MSDGPDIAFSREDPPAWAAIWLLTKKATKQIDDEGCATKLIELGSSPR
jgi:hypothetical protein